MLSFFNFKRQKTISFSNLPLLIQERFAEICDTQTLMTFSKINQRTKWISRKRKIVESFRIHDGCYDFCCKNNGFHCSRIDNFDKSIEVIDDLVISMRNNLTEDSVKRIQKTYSKLRLYLNLVDFNAFKHIIDAPNLETCNIVFIIPPNLEITELQNNLRILVKLLTLVKFVRLHIRLFDHEEIIQNELLKLTERPHSILPNTKKDKLTLNFSTFNYQTGQYFCKYLYERDVKETSKPEKNQK